LRIFPPFPKKEKITHGKKSLYLFFFPFLVPPPLSFLTEGIFIFILALLLFPPTSCDSNDKRIASFLPSSLSLPDQFCPFSLECRRNGLVCYLFFFFPFFLSISQNSEKHADFPSILSPLFLARFLFFFSMKLHQDLVMVVLFFLSSLFYFSVREEFKRFYSSLFLL